MTVSVCASEEETGECEKCPCAVGRCDKYPFGQWLHFTCHSLRGSFLRVENQHFNSMFIVEIEAFGSFIDEESEHSEVMTPSASADLSQNETVATVGPVNE